MSYRLLLIIILVLVCSNLKSQNYNNYTDINEISDVSESTNYYYKKFSYDNFIKISYLQNKSKPSTLKNYLQVNKFNNKIYLYNHNHETNIYTEIYAERLKLGFGNYRLNFGLGNNYKGNCNTQFTEKVVNSNCKNFRGIYLEYNVLNNISYSIFYSNTDYNYIKTDKTNNLVYSNGVHDNMNIFGNIIKYKNEKYFLSILYNRYILDNRLVDFNNKLRFNNLMVSACYMFPDFKIGYEGDYHFNNWEHKLDINIITSKVKTKIEYEKIPKHALVWYRRGISNRFKSDYKAISVKNLLNIKKIKISYFLELFTQKTNNDYNIHSGFCYKKNCFKYSLTYDKYINMNQFKRVKIKNRVIFEVLNYRSSRIICSLCLNNKRNSSKKAINSYFEYIYGLKRVIGKLKINFLNNYKDEELVTDIDDIIIADTYNTPTEIITTLNIQGKISRNLYIMLKCAIHKHSSKYNSIHTCLKYHLF